MAIEKMSAKHTPAPWNWNWQPSNDVEDMPELRGGNNEIIMDFGNCAQYYPTEGSAPNEANAKLIAAAPELLEALVAMVEVFEPLANENNIRIDNVKRIIKKATE
jgi:hypothetical protein